MKSRSWYNLVELLIFALLGLSLTLTVAKSEGNCDIHATILRQVGNAGFHRDVYSLVEIITSHPSLSDDCSVILIENLPSGLYVNPDQLADLRRVGQLSACPSAPVDVETPQQDSDPVTVYVYTPLNETENLLSASISLPVHIRYHSPTDDGGFSRVFLHAPSLLMRCKDKVPCNNEEVQLPCQPCGEELCQWQNVSFKTNSPQLVMQVPVGNIGHYPLVAVVTLLVTCGGCFYILSALAGSWPDDHEKED